MVLTRLTQNLAIAAIAGRNGLWPPFVTDRLVPRRQCTLLDALPNGALHLAGVGDSAFR